ncbi:MAG TPA: YIP1 family protein [Candidatus Cryosericum sp.]|nr:YIP1 family protein [Candidatus Cryosericum sp.]
MSSDYGDPAPPPFGAPQAPEPPSPPVIEPRYEPPPPPPPPQTPAPPQEPLNPWFSMWVMPRATMRQILDTNPSRFVHLLAILVGIVEVMRSHLPNPPFAFDLGVLLTVKAVVGALAGLFALYLWSMLIWMTGKWLSGKGNFIAVRAAVAWSNVILIWSAMLWLPLIAYLGAEAFNLDPETILTEPSGLLLMIPLGLMAIVVGIWWLVVFMKCVGEAHGFSAWHSFGAFLIACIIFAIPIVMLAVLAASILGIAGLSSLAS